jgi:hypothetical protein
MRKTGTDEIACRVAFGTTTLKTLTRLGRDLIIQNALDLDLVGLPCATRFDLDSMATLPWKATFFGCWRGYRTPIIGALTEELVKEYAYLMMRRHSI